jgi:hypothetical protein
VGETDRLGETSDELHEVWGARRGCPQNAPLRRIRPSSIVSRASRCGGAPVAGAKRSRYRTSRDCHACRARVIVARPSALTRQEFRFLRQYLGHSRKISRSFSTSRRKRCPGGRTGSTRFQDRSTFSCGSWSRAPSRGSTNTDEQLAKLRPQPRTPPRISSGFGTNTWQAVKAA